MNHGNSENGAEHHRLPQAHTAESLIAEFRQTVAERASVARGQVAGRRRFHELHLQAEGRDEKRSAAWWVYLAQLGTLDKLELLLQREGPYETFELLAVARNLFENLVWLRLFNQELGYGLVFYAQFLLDQVASYHSYVEKLSAEAELFDLAEAMDEDLLSCAYDGLINRSPDATKAEWRAAGDEHKRREAELDDMVRREFSLFRGPAAFNSYGVQARELRDNVIPRYRNRHDVALAELKALSADLPQLLSPKLATIATAKKWNWRERATLVQMVRHYDFLYGYTSRLLHATPLNIVTDKTLSASEAMIVADYIVVAAGDLFDQIERFSPRGQIDAFAISLE